MIRRIALRILIGKCDMPEGQFYRRSLAWSLRQRVNDQGQPAWTWHGIATRCHFKSAEAAAIAVAVHDVYILETTAAQIAKRQAGHPMLIDAYDPNDPTYSTPGAAKIYSCNPDETDQ